MPATYTDIEAAVIADAEAANASNRRIANDWMVRRLNAICKASRSEITADGKRGFDQMMANAMSARAMRRQRAALLLQARSAKLFNGCKIAKLLDTAKLYRKDEHADAAPRVLEAAE